MEEEERAAQSAKLQELIRRGGPEDLQEANRLMKVMAGYDTRHKTDYRAKAAEEVSKIQQKAKILEEMLQSHKPGDKLGEGDVFEVRRTFPSLRLQTNAARNLPVHYKALIQRSRRCAKRSRTIPKRSPSFWK
jgi:hypothetical protein